MVALLNAVTHIKNSSSMKTVRDERLDIKLAMFNHSVVRDVHLPELVNVTLRGRELDAALTDKLLDNETTQKVFSIIISGLEHNRLREIQKRETTYSPWQKCNQLYGHNPIVNERSKLNDLPDFKYSADSDMADNWA